MYNVSNYLIDTVFKMYQQKKHAKVLIFDWRLILYDRPKVKIMDLTIRYLSTSLTENELRVSRSSFI